MIIQALVEKINKNALPDPKLLEPQVEFVAPSSEVEIYLCEVCQDLLDIQRLGVNDNFFAVGGHSLIATRLVAQVNEYYGINLSIKEIFNIVSIKVLAETIEKQVTVSKLLSGELSVDDLSENQLDVYLELVEE